MNGSGIDIAWYSYIFLVPYLFIMFRICQGLERIGPVCPKPSSSVKISVIIPVRKSPQEMEGLLSDLALQNYSHNLYEVIIADDTGGKWDNHPHRNDIPLLRVVPNKASGKKSAIDTAISKAEGELIITTDDDCRVGKEWILAIASHYSRSKPGLILCPVELTGGNSPLHALQQLEFFSLQGVTAGSASLGDPLMCNGAGMAFRRDLYPGLNKLPSSDIPSGDDIFLLHYLKNKGVSVEWAENESATVTTEPAQSITEFIRQRSRWASKSVYYKDSSSVIAGLAVLTVSIIIAAYIIMSVVNPVFIKTALGMLLLKSIPDSVIIMNRLKFHNRTNLIWYFPLAQLVYPFYVIIVSAIGLLGTRKW
jgi:cellulose synthase/poly-beta-1,6-N-acetylglucosamine synthase-like glycosyltransferase